MTSAPERIESFAVGGHECFRELEPALRRLVRAQRSPKTMHGLVRALGLSRVDSVLERAHRNADEQFVHSVAIKRRTLDVESLSERTDRRIIIVALTANVMAGDREKSLAAGMDDYLAKPVSRTDLARTIQKWMDMREQDGNGEADGEERRKAA